MELIRYWIEFDTQEELPPGVQLGCGVTAIDYSDALNLIGKKIFNNQNTPQIKTCIENIDIRKLDQGHVIPNMLPPNSRGIWFPLGYQY